MTNERAGPMKATRPLPLPRRALHGVLLLDKPVGLSSNDALQKAKRLLRAEKAGHTGTLDPLASGLLPICLGAATKFSQASLDADKAYRATLRLGQVTTTADAEGEIVSEHAVQVDRAAIEAACARFTGPIEQVPPMHSALKRDGRALYEYARAGIEVEREPRRVTIHKLVIVDWQDTQLVLDVTCSKGTYIRTLAQDIGQALKIGLNSPWDLQHLDGTLYIAMAGPHQLWRHRLGGETINLLAGTLGEDIIDGPHDYCALAQPSGITTDGQVLYFVDSEGSAVRRATLGDDGEIVTIAGPHDLGRGRALFEFGDVDGKGLYITACDAVYRIRLKVAGVMPGPKS